MKKIFILLFAILLGLLISSCSYDPYTGKYTSPQNEIINLRSGNKCTFTVVMYKNFYDINGEYHIKDGKISINFKHDNLNYFVNKHISGKVEGTRLNLMINSKRRMFFFKE